MVVKSAQDGCQVSTGWLSCQHRMVVKSVQNGFQVSTGWLSSQHRMVVKSVRDGCQVGRIAVLKFHIFVLFRHLWVDFKIPYFCSVIVVISLGGWKCILRDSFSKQPPKFNYMVLDSIFCRYFTREEEEASWWRSPPDQHREEATWLQGTQWVQIPSLQEPCRPLVERVRPCVSRLPPVTLSLGRTSGGYSFSIQAVVCREGKEVQQKCFKYSTKPWCRLFPSTSYFCFTPYKHFWFHCTHLYFSTDLELS